MSPEQASPANTRDQDWQLYQQLLQLWQAENSIKTIKLQFLLGSNGVLLGFLHINGGIVAENILLMTGAALLCLIWTLSIGRTALFQTVWKIKLNAIAQRHPDDECFQLLDNKAAVGNAPVWLRILGGISSKYYLLGAPLGLTLAWLCGVIAAY